MKKTILISGGASVVSLAVGVVSGYLIAKRRFNNELPGIIESETNAIKKYHSVLLQEAYSGKPRSPEDIPRHREVDEENDVEEARPVDEELTEKDREVREKGQRTLAKASRALTDYNGISTKAANNDQTSAQVVKTNIFDEASKKKPLPPRDDQGHFRKRTAREKEYDPPQLISLEDFLANDPENQQENLLYFFSEKTLVMEADPTEPVDVAKAGEVNLTLFPDVPEGEESVIYVRNEGLATDYEIKKMAESLTDYVGLGEEDAEDDADSARYL